MKKYFLIVACAGMCLIDGCRHNTNNATTFRWNISSGLNSLDPAQMGDVAAGEVGLQIFEGLVKLDSAGLVQPSVALRWEVGDSGRAWTFHLRSGVRFQDDSCFANGTRRTLTAGDVKFSFERICDPRTRSTGWWIFHERVVGADAFHDAIETGSAIDGVHGIEAIDDSTVTIHLQSSFAPFLSMLTMPYGFIVAHEAALRYGKDLFKHPVGTGAYKLDHWTPDEELVLVKNKNYWNDARGTIETVRISFVRDVKTEFLEFTRGNYDLTMAVPQGFENTVFDSVGNLSSEYKKFTLRSLPALTTEYYGIFLDSTMDAAKRSPLATNVLLRRALNYAVDRDAIIRYVLRGQAIAARGVIPPAVAGYDSTRPGYSFDLATAKSLLAQAGYPDGHGLPPLTLQLGPSEQTASVAEAVQQQWKEIGVNVTLRQVDFPQHLDMIRSGKLPLWRTQWVGDYCDAENFLALFARGNFSPGGPNTTHYSDPRFDALYTMSLEASLAQPVRTQLYRSMDSLVTMAAPWILLYYPRNVRLLQPEITTFTCDPLGRFAVADIIKK